MNRDEKLNIIRQKCIEANLKLGELWECNYCGHEYRHEIRLAHVLLAIPKALHVNRDDYAPDCQWNLRADDLREQSDETIEFLYSLLQ